MKQYLDSLQYILKNGEMRNDRTGTGTISVFGMQQRYNLEKGFPAVTTKKLAFKAMKSELLWFLEGSNDERRLAEILHGDRNTEKKTIWTDNANSDYWKHKAKFDGDLGNIYGVQWRSWPKFVQLGKQEDETLVGRMDHVDQVAELIDGLKNDPFSRRHILSAWNPGELDNMALPPCHVMSQFYVSSNNKLSCMMTQRSQDALLGAPFNIASYALLTHMIAQVCGYGVGEFIYSIGDAHIYLNHIDAVHEQLNNEPYPSPTLWLNPEIDNIFDFTMNDIRLENYKSHGIISAPMAV